MQQPWMHNQCGRNLKLTCPPYPRDSIKDVDYMHMSPQLSMIGHGKAPQNNLFSISMNNLGKLDDLTPLDEQLPQVDTPTNCCYICA